MVLSVYDVELTKQKHTKRRTQMNSTPNLIQNSNSSQEFFCSNNVNPAASHLIGYLKKLKLQKNFSDSVTDPREGKCSYSLGGLLHLALSTVLFRTGSKHAFHQEGKQTQESAAAIAKFAGIESDKLPSTRTIDDMLNRLDHEEMNEALMSIFEVLRKDKFFASHPELTPKGAYHLAIDAETIHKYTSDSAHAYEKCPYCLKRERGDTSWYVHMQVVASVVCPGNIQIPLYVYPIHAKSLRCNAVVSDETFKQECELSAFPVILNKIRERFPKLHFCVLADSLYANGPAMKTAEENRMDFMIVRKKGSMKTVGEDCDGLEKVIDHKATSQVDAISNEKGKKIKRSWRFFNDLGYQDMKLNILRFEEWIFDKNGKQTNYVFWEWIVSWKLTKSNVVTTTCRGRMRWLEEDLFNSVKNRGFNIKHDYSRNSSAQIVWSILIMIAFLVSELFTFVTQVIPIRKNRSLRDFMRSIFADLCKLCQAVFQASILKRKTQYRYCFEKAYFSSKP